MWDITPSERGCPYCGGVDARLACAKGDGSCVDLPLVDPDPSLRPGEVSKERLERACRLYSTNREAALALGVHSGSLGRMCRRHSIATPAARRRQRRKGRA